MRQILLTFFMLLLTAGAYAQCPPGDVTLASQVEVNQFIIDYPDCTSINGVLKIGYLQQTSNDITDITPLQNINNAIGVGIYNTQLEDLQGLDNLIFVDGDLSIGFNPQLNSLHGLENFKAASTLFIYNNPFLTNLEGLNSLEVIYTSLNIMNNPSLVNLQGLESLETVSVTLEGGDNPNGEIYIARNHALVNLNGLNNLTRIGGQLLINDHNSLENLQGLENLTFIGGALRLQELPSLTSINALSNLTEVNKFNGRVQLATLPVLESLHGLEQITEMGNLYIHDCDALVNLEGLNNLELIRYRVQAENLFWADGQLLIQYNDSLTSLDGLNNLTTVGTVIKITNNPLLESISDIENLEYLGCDLQVNYNQNLTSLQGLDSLTRLGYFVNCDHPQLFVVGNPVLGDIESLASLSDIGPAKIDNIYIAQNPQLTSLEGIQNIPTNKIDNVIFTDSEDLSVCNLPNICQHLSNGGAHTISGNTTGCNSAEEILDLCELSIDEVSDLSEITLYPVPTKEVLNIQTKNGALIETVTFYDLNGKLVYRSNGNNSKIDISHFTTGTYLVSVKTSKGVHNEKIIKK